MHVRRFVTLGLAFLAVAFAARSASAQLIEKKTLSLAAAKKMAAAAEAEAAKNKWTMVVAVLALGHVTAIQGGLPVMMNGQAIGSIGVSGAMPDQDAQCAKAGLAALQ